MMTDNRELAAALGVLMVAWVPLGYTVGYFTGFSAYDLWIAFVGTLLVLIFTPAVMSKVSWTAPGAVVVGVINIIIHILAVITSPMSKVFALAVALVLDVLFIYFSFRAYQEK